MNIFAIYLLATLGVIAVLFIVWFILKQTNQQKLSKIVENVIDSAVNVP